MYQDSRSVYLAADAEIVWRQVGEFAFIDSWMPGIDQLEVTLAEDGSVDTREILAGGQVFIEKHLRTDMAGMVTWYILVAPELPVQDHLAALSVTANGTGRCAVTWSASFNMPTGGAAESAGADEVAWGVLGTMTAAFEYGLEALSSKFGVIDAEQVPVWDRYPDISMDEDTLPLYEGWASRQLVMPFCDSCQRWHGVFRGWCPHCRSNEVAAKEVAGTGTVHAAMRLHHGPVHPWVRYPVWVLTIDLDEQAGLRRTGLLVGREPEWDPVGQRVSTVFIDRCGAPQPAFALVGAAQGVES